MTGPKKAPLITTDVGARAGPYGQTLAPVTVATIEGYAAIFDKPDLEGDIVAPGAFAKSLAEGAPVRMLYQHKAETPIGRWLEFREDKKGLFAVGEIVLNAASARDVYELIAGGAINGLSIGYRTIKARKARRAAGGGRRIMEADLWEVSVVTFPMAPRALITSVGAPSAQPPSFLSPERPCAFLPEAQADRRAHRAPPAPCPLGGGASARHFADALRSAARTLSA
ncbi:MAG: HK97 family phage prohead protease [Pseudomonadota bacterium]